MTLKRSYLVLAAALVACAVVIWRANSEGLVSGLASNLLSEIVGIIATVVLIDRVLRIAEEKKATKLKRIAFMRLSVPLEQHVELWLQIFKTCLPERPPILPTEIDDLRRPEYMKHLRDFDVAARAPAYGNPPWCLYLKASIEGTNRQLEVVLDKYAVFLDPEEIEAIEKCGNSNFMTAMPGLLAMFLPSPAKMNFPVLVMDSDTAPGDDTPFVTAHLASLSELISIARKNLAHSESFKLSPSSWSDIVGGKFGSARFLVKPTGTAPVASREPPPPPR